MQFYSSEKLTWLKVNACDEVQPRVGHVMFTCYSGCPGKKKEIMVFGGGDNRGTFFSDLIKVQSFNELKIDLS